MHKHLTCFTRWFNGLLLFIIMVTVAGCGQLPDFLNNTKRSPAGVVFDAAKLLTLNKGVESDLVALRKRLDNVPKGKYTPTQIAAMYKALDDFSQVHKDFNRLLDFDLSKEQALAALAFYTQYGKAKLVYINLRRELGDKVYQDKQLRVIDQRFTEMDKTLMTIYQRLQVNTDTDVTAAMGEFITTLRMLLRLRV